jgi:hypothetical protein
VHRIFHFTVFGADRFLRPITSPQKSETQKEKSVMRFIIETINSQRHARRFIVEYIFVNAYRQYGNCRRTERQSKTLQLAGHRLGVLSSASEIEVEIEAAGEIDGADVQTFQPKQNHLIIQITK